MFERNIIPTQEKPKEKFPNVDHNIAENLEKIDFEKMRDLFSQKIVGLGLDQTIYKERLIVDGKNFVDSVPFGKNSARGSFHGLKRGVHVDKRNFENEKKEGFIFGEFKYVLSIVSHEETHALADQYLIKNSEKIYHLDYSYTSGYASHNAGLKYFIIPKREIVWQSLNEAVTELISREILQDYFADERSSWASETAIYESYEKDIDLFNKVCERICDECDIEQEVFWKVVQRGYFTGETLSGEKMDRLFQDIFPEDFIAKLGKTKALPSKEEISNIINLLEQSEWTDDDRKRVRRWVLYIYHQMPNSQEK